MELLVLGPVEARLDGQRYAIGGVKQQALLSRLLVAKGRPVSVARLCDELWDDNAPKDPVHALQARVSRLRSALPTLRIEQISGGYRLDHLGVHTDIAQFEKLREEGSWLLAEGMLPRAAECLRAALDLWRGPAFGDFPEIPSLQAEAVRLEKLWESALADMIDIDLALGNEAEVTPRLAALVEEHPLLERLRGQLMVALYRQGRMQEALATYARAREIFTERFGVEPNGELGQLHVQILQEVPSASLLRVRAESDTPQKAMADPRVQITPDTPVTSNDAEALAGLLSRYPALIVTGAPGIGKTHLLRSVRAHLEADRSYAPLVTATALSQSIPLGVFMGVAGSSSRDWRTAADVIDAFTRHRTRSVLLVDNVNMLDETSLFVICQLINTASMSVIIAAPSVTQAPEALRALYDSGQVTEVAMTGLSDDAAYEMASTIARGPLTPDTRLRILDVAGGVPLRIREIITGSKGAARLIATASGWALDGDPVPSPRLVQLSEGRLEALDAANLEALALVAIAGEYPSDALEPGRLRELSRAHVLSLSDNGWLRLADPMDEEVLRARFPEVLWNALTREVVQVLQSELARAVPEAHHRAHLLALDLGDAVDVPATVALAERALGALQGRLAWRATNRVIAQEPEHVEAHRIAAKAASMLGMPDEAEQHFETAYGYASSSVERATVTSDHAQHYGLRLHDAHRALEIVDRALSEVQGTSEVAHLERARMRWLTVAGQGGATATMPEMPADVASVMGLIAVGFASVITGPLEEAERVLAQVREVPGGLLALVPGGRTMAQLIEIMAVSDSGDVVSARRMLTHQISQAHAHAPESLGEWEYALSFMEMLSGDAATAHTVALNAVEHLQWRDSSGLLPAALALRAAGAVELVGSREAVKQFPSDEIPETAAGDPKVVMLRRWADARDLHAEGNVAEGARILVDVAEWLLTAQHTYFAGMCAHYAVRTGNEVDAALRVLADAYAVAGGGLLALLMRHAEATRTFDLDELDVIAREARDLGLTATALDTSIFILEHLHAETDSVRMERQRNAVAALYREAPTVVSWAPKADRWRAVSGV